jgi:hypothetical protein
LLIFYSKFLGDRTYYSLGSDYQCIVNVNRMLYKLICILMASDCLKSITVNLDLRLGQYNGSGLEGGLYPLCLLLALRSRGIDVQLHGLPARVENYFTKWAVQHSLKGDTLGRLLAHADRAWNILSHLHEPADQYYAIRKLALACKQTAGLRPANL